ncbi:MAG TPA: arginyltransferase [Burkholderiaceae bacterium]|nr:arginyltransferase [Burkholderiaceae bacterium]
MNREQIATGERIRRAQLAPGGPCANRPPRQITWLIASRDERLPKPDFSELNRAGFRRHGSVVLRTACAGCNACIPVRVPVERFAPSRVQRYIWRRLSHLTVHRLPMIESDEQFALYLRYQRARHPGNGLDNEAQFRHLLLTTPTSSRMLEFRDRGELKMVSVVDELDDGWSLIYSFFDPDDPSASFGVYSILWQIAAVRLSGLAYYYPGYWIEGSDKQGYKDQFQPFEVLEDGRWKAHRPAELQRPCPG